MVKDTTGGYGRNGWLRTQWVVKETMTGIQNMFFIFQVFKACCYGCSNLRMTQKSKNNRQIPKLSQNDPKIQK